MNRRNFLAGLVAAPVTYVFAPAQGWGPPDRYAELARQLGISRAEVKEALFGMPRGMAQRIDFQLISFENGVIRGTARIWPYSYAGQFRASALAGAMHVPDSPTYGYDVASLGELIGPDAWHSTRAEWGEAVKDAIRMKPEQLECLRDFVGSTPAR